MPIPDFKEIKSNFPDTVWDGTSQTRGVSEATNRDPMDGFDRAQMVAEIIATQQAVLDGGGEGGGGVPEDFNGLVYYKDGVPLPVEVGSRLSLNFIPNESEATSVSLNVAAELINIDNVTTEMATINNLTLGQLNIDVNENPPPNPDPIGWIVVQLADGQPYKIPVYTNVGA